jgi:hypothetical protein
MIANAALLAPVLLLASCAAAPPPTPGMACGVTGASEWRAWINAMPGPNARPNLVATGKVTVPTGGWRFEWGEMRVMESYPVQVVAELRTIAPDGPATQAVTTHDVRGEWPIDPPVGSFTIRCGDMVLATVSPVETAQ